MEVEWYILLDKVVFLDRDGVINKCAPPHDYIKKWDEFIFLPFVIDAIRELNIAGYKVIIVSNQRGIARGIMTQDNVDKIHCNMQHELSENNAMIDYIFVCPHEKGVCDCRKPKIGLFVKAEQYYDIDKKKSFMIGDSFSDIWAGNAYGVHTIFIGDKFLAAEFSCANLKQAVGYILGEVQK